MSARPGWLSSALLIGAANLLPLAGWWWNRSGEPEAAVELSEHDAYVVRGGDEDSSVRLRLSLAEPWPPGPDSSDMVAIGFDADLLAVGFDQPLPPRRPSRRPAWVLLRVEEPQSLGDPTDRGMLSGLRPVAVGTSPGELYRRSGDRGRHIVMRGVVGLSRVPMSPEPIDGTGLHATWSARVDLVSPATLHVPKSLVPILERLAPVDRPSGTPRYRVRVSMGRLHLPRVTGVEPVPGG